MTITQATAIFCTALLVAQNPYTFAQQTQPAQQAQPANAPQAQPQRTYSPGQLDSLVAPIALYPDEILSQVLVASTYPLEVVEAGRWLKQHSNLQGQALADAVRQQNWDASVQALVALPDVLNKMEQNISWTADLGNAVLAQQPDVMAAVQRLRQRASDSGALKSTPEQTVTTQTENGNNYIVIQPASPEVVSIPQYNPQAVWGPPPDYYPYPAMYYPPYTPGAYLAASAISFGAGVALGAFWGGGWGWGFGWGGGNININNNFARVNHLNSANIGRGNRWQHNPAHRGNVPYNNRAVGNRFQGNRPNVATRPSAAQMQQRLGQGGGVANRMQQGNLGQRGGPGAANRMQGNPGQGRSFGANRPGQGGVGQANRMAGSAGQMGGGNRIGNRNVGGGSGHGAFGGINQGGARARANSNRGFSSGGAGFRGGGGGFRGGGGGGGFRGGGGGFRGGGGGGRRR